MRVAWSLCAGAVAGALAGPSAGEAWAAIAAGLLLLGARRGTTSLLSLALLGFGCAGVSGDRAGGDGVLRDLAREVPRCEIRARVLERAGGLGTTLAVRALDCGEARFAGDLGIVVVDGSPLDPGGRVTAVGRLLPLGREGFSRARAGLGAEAEMDIEEVVSSAPPRSIWLRVAAGLRAGVQEAGARMPAQRAALMSGLTIGETGGLGAGTERRMRRAGLSHLVAVSGSNVAIVVGAAFLAMRRAGKVAGVIAGAVALLVYVMTVGPEPSVLRAAAMGGIALVALLSGRKVAPLVALGLALSAVIVVRPQMVGSIGLQLSAAATAGLILWAGPMARRITVFPRPVALIAGATLAAQAAVAPLLLVAFGQVSVVAPLANLLALPAVPVATIVGLGSGALAAVAPELGAASARLCEPALAWILWVGDTLGSVPAATLALPGWVGIVAAVPLAAAAWLAARSAGSDSRDTARSLGS